MNRELRYMGLLVIVVFGTLFSGLLNAFLVWLDFLNKSSQGLETHGIGRDLVGLFIVGLVYGFAVWLIVGLVSVRKILAGRWVNSQNAIKFGLITGLGVGIAGWGVNLFRLDSFYLIIGVPAIANGLISAIVFWFWLNIPLKS